MIFKEYTKEEHEAWEAWIIERYNRLLDDADKVIDYTIEAYKASESEENYAMMMEAVDHKGKILEDLCDREVRKAQQQDRERQIREDFFRKIEETRREAETQSLISAVRRIDDTVSLLRQQGQRKRQGFSPQAKALLIKATEAMGGWCPCCAEQSVVKDGERTAGAEFDHFFANHLALPDAGWLICQKCHRLLTHNAGLRTEKAQAFFVFQAHRKAVETHPRIDMNGSTG